jgi:hypothetical protein
MPQTMYEYEEPRWIDIYRKNAEEIGESLFQCHFVHGIRLAYLLLAMSVLETFS